MLLAPRTVARLAALALLVPLTCWAQNTGAADTLERPGLSPTDISAIRATSERWTAAMRAGRWQDAAATFTEDAILRFPDAVYQGRAAILNYFQTMPPWNPTRVLHIDEINGRGDLAYVMGHSTIIPDGGGPPVVVGRYLDIRLRQPDGRWLFYRDMVTPVTPPVPKRQ